MTEIAKKIRYILQYHFDQGDDAIQACEKICAFYGPDTISKSEAQKWFLRFRCGDVEIKDTHSPNATRQTVAENEDEILKKIQGDRYISTCDIAADLNMDQYTVMSHLRSAGYEKSSMFGCHEI